MLGLEVIVGWFKENVAIPDIRNVITLEVFQFGSASVAEEASLREQGKNFEIEEVTRLMNRLKNFKYVTFLNPRTGTVITPDNVQKFLVKDGGIDYKIVIVTPTDHGAKVVAGQIRAILLKGDY